MPNGCAHASPEAMERMLKNINGFIQVQQDMISALKRDIKTVGEEWQDQQFYALSHVLHETITKIEQTKPVLNNTTSQLKSLKQALEDYLNRRIG